MSNEAWVRQRIDPDGVVRVTFDRPGDRINLLTPDTLRQLDAWLADLARREDVRALLFDSAKPGMFIAGMDVEEIAAIDDAFRGAEAARFGQSVFQRIADLRIPTACAIDGPCLGGGTELALACDHRIASDRPEVRIGLPEVRLGILPGFGGTQRLPRLVGLGRALDLILTGRQLDARGAERAGLVDRVVPAVYLEREALALLRLAAEDPARAAKSVRRKRSVLASLLENTGPLRRLVLARARRRTAAKAAESDYPAPFRILDGIEAAFALPLRQGLDVEARLVGELIASRTSKNLIWLFKTQTAVKKDPDGLRAAPRRIRRVAVVGAGIMGGGISTLAAERGIPVRLRDVRAEALWTALRTASGIWREQVRKKRMTPREAAHRLAFIAPTVTDTGLSRVDLVVEAVVEALEVKQQVLADAEARIGERTVFASNTSSIPISDIAARALRPERVVGLHFFNPVHRMPLVEVIAGQKSSPEAIATVRAFAVELGKTPIIVQDSPGFLVNRILMLYLNEAMHLLSEGVRVEAVDAAATAFGMPLGPFALLDQVGLDTAHHVAGVLQAAFGGRIGGTPPVLSEMVAAGRLGAKNGRGFYVHRPGRGPVPDRKGPAAGKAPARELPVETIQERMVLAMLAEAIVCLEEGVVREPRDVDLGMVLGAGFPPFRGGLLRHADAVGLPIVADRLSRLAEAQGERFRPPGLLRDRVREQRPFYP